MTRNRSRKNLRNRETRAEQAARLGVSLRTLHRMINDGRVDATPRRVLRGPGCINPDCKGDGVHVALGLCRTCYDARRRKA